MAETLPPVVYDSPVRGVGSVRHQMNRLPDGRSIFNIRFYSDANGEVAALFGTQRKVTVTVGKKIAEANVQGVVAAKTTQKIEALFAIHGNAVPSGEISMSPSHPGASSLPTICER